MPHPNWLSKGATTVIADTSIMINLCACGAGQEILSALPVQIAMASEAIREVACDRRTGRQDDIILAGFISAGLVVELPLDEAEQGLFGELVIGPAVDTLDDGEAATIALALKRELIAAIDENKANGLCARRFPDLIRVSSTDLFLHDAVVQRLGQLGLCNALFNALKLARMRVQDHHLELIVASIGTERLSECPSLPAVIRQRSLATTGQILPKLSGEREDLFSRER